MKRIYLLAMAICALAFTTDVNAQLIEDDFEFYNPGPMGDQAPWWTTWSGVTGTAEDIQVVDNNGSSGDQSGNVPEGQTCDALLLLGNQTTGQYTVRWQMYVPSGKTGYWNIQEDETPGIQWNADFYVDVTGSGGSAGMIQHDQSGSEVPYPNDTWFEVLMEIDLDAATLSVKVDGADLLTDEAYPGSQLGAIDFFSIDANNNYNVDDVYYIDEFLGANDFDPAVFSVYPNPVQDILNINSAATVDAVTIYDVLGKVVLTAQPDSVSPSINVSSLSSGAYMVQVTIDGATKTVKVVK